MVNVQLNFLVVEFTLNAGIQFLKKWGIDSHTVDNRSEGNKMNTAYP